MRKILINTDLGTYGLSKKVMQEYAQLKNYELVEEYNNMCSTFFYAVKDKKGHLTYHNTIARDDPALITAVEKVGLKESRGCYARLKIVEIPDDVQWEIYDYDGSETVIDRNRVWR